MYNLPQKYPIIRCINSTVNKQVCDLSYALNRTLKCKFSDNDFYQLQCRACDIKGKAYIIRYWRLRGHRLHKSLL